MKELIFSSLLFLLCIGTNAQEAIDKGLKALNEDVIKGQLDFLASDWMNGRNTGEEGAYMAADYIASMFQVYGVQPFGDSTMWYPSREERKKGVKPELQGSYFQNIPMVEYYQGNDNRCTIIKCTKDGAQKTHLNFKTDFSISNPGYSFECEAPVVFVG